MPSQTGHARSKLCESLLILAELEAAAKLESLVLSPCRVASLPGRGARVSEQEGQIIIDAAQGGAAQTVPMSFKDGNPMATVDGPQGGRSGLSCCPGQGQQSH